jgi:two-component system KDP operon response regulator KdpE
MKKILIIEDDPSTARAMQVRLHAHGYDTAVAGDAVAGSHQARHTQPDLIFLDLGLPGGDGLDLAKRFQNWSETCHTPVILVTGRKDPDLYAKALGLHAAGLFEKPYDAEELLAVTRLALREGSGKHEEAARA